MNVSPDLLFRHRCPPSGSHSNLIDKNVSQALPFVGALCRNFVKKEVSDELPFGRCPPLEFCFRSSLGIEKKKTRKKHKKAIKSARFVEGERSVVGRDHNRKKDGLP